MRYRLAEVHSYTHTCRHMDLSVAKDMLLCCSEALPSNCHPLCDSFYTTTHTLANQHYVLRKQVSCPCTQKICITHTKTHSEHFHSLCRLCILHHTRRNTIPPSSSSVSPYLTIQSEAGGDFLGVVAEPIVARLLPHCVPLPHLYTLPHTTSCPAALSLLPLLINYSAFCQDTCMRLHTNPQMRAYSINTHTQRQRKVLMRRVVLVEHEQPSPVVGWGGDIRLGYCRMEPCLLFYLPLIIQITLQCNR